MKENQSKMIIYKTSDGRTKINVSIDGDTVWLTQAQMAELFDVSIPTINEHLKNIFGTEELYRDSAIRNLRITAKDGKYYEIMHYNLDVIISLGYRVNSKSATQFRIWATTRLKEYIVKGFTMDDERLKQGRKDVRFFDELLERIRDIRASERNFYQKIRHNG